MNLNPEPLLARPPLGWTSCTPGEYAFACVRKPVFRTETVQMFDGGAVQPVFLIYFKDGTGVGCGVSFTTSVVSDDNFNSMVSGSFHTFDLNA